MEDLPRSQHCLCMQVVYLYMCCSASKSPLRPPCLCLLVPPSVATLSPSLSVMPPETGSSLFREAARLTSEPAHRASAKVRWPVAFARCCWPPCTCTLKEK